MRCHRSQALQILRNRNLASCLAITEPVPATWLYTRSGTRPKTTGRMAMQKKKEKKIKSTVEGLTRCVIGEIYLRL